MLRAHPQKKQLKNSKPVSKVCKKTTALKKKTALKTTKRSMSGCPFSTMAKKPVSLPPGMTEEDVSIVKSCVPILEQGGVALTTHFYKNMLNDEQDAVKPFFNPTHQIELSQPKALAYSVLCYAKHIDDLGSMLGSADGQKLIATIVKKHLAVQVLPEHYPIVGKHLLRAIREVLGPEVATDQVLNAWGKAYGVLSDLLIGLEATGYDQLASVPNGWRGKREFKIIGKEYANDEKSAISYIIQSEDGKGVMKPLGGQYLTLRLKDDKNNINTTRNYSLSDVVREDENGIGNTYRFTTQIQDKGVVTNYLKEFKNVGDSLSVHPITGEFTLRDIILKDGNEVINPSSNDKATTFIAAGSGITPFMSMVRSYRKHFPNRPLNLIHISTNKNKELFSKDKDEFSSKFNVNIQNVFTDVDQIVQNDMNNMTPFYKNLLKTNIIDHKSGPTPAENIYIVGPAGFMKNTHNVLTQDLKLDGKKINYEFFGPATFFE